MPCFDCARDYPHIHAGVKPPARTFSIAANAAEFMANTGQLAVRREAITGTAAVHGDLPRDHGNPGPVAVNRAAITETRGRFMAICREITETRAGSP